MQLSDVVDAVRPGRDRAGASAETLELLRRESARAIAACNAAETLAAMGQRADANVADAIAAATAIADALHEPAPANLDDVNAVIRRVAQRYAEPGGLAIERAVRFAAIAVALVLAIAIIVKL